MSFPEEGRRVQADMIVPIDPGLEDAIRNVKTAVERYLDDLSEDHRDELRSALEELDVLLEDADTCKRWLGTVTMITPGPTTVGATSLNGMVEAVPGTLFQEQIALVRAAKKVVGDELTAQSLSALRDVNADWARRTGER